MIMKKNFILFMAVVFASFSAQSCLKNENEYEKQKKVDDQILAEFVQNNAQNATRHSAGFYYEKLDGSENASLPQAGAELKKNDIVTFKYRMSLLNGAHIETNWGEDNKPEKMKLMTYTVIPEALDHGVNLMKVGETYRFYIPSYLAYGSYSTEEFGPNTNFVIDIKVLGVESEEQIELAQLDSIANYIAASNEDYMELESGLYLKDSIPGTGGVPFNGSGVVIDFTRKYLDNSVIYNVEGTTLYLDRGMAVPGLEEGIKLTKEGGTSVLIMPASIGFKQSVSVLPRSARPKLFQDKIINNNVEPYSILKYVVNLKVVNL